MKRLSWPCLRGLVKRKRKEEEKEEEERLYGSSTADVDSGNDETENAAQNEEAPAPAQVLRHSKTYLRI